ncbi:MAG TPA: hypothetical protein VHV74_09770 [Pseudonocardiaceae bacterium]|jgi:hypothetical protein|nr:hypothetical protein [Pseudonocardiaceae bacterium]
MGRRGRWAPKRNLPLLLDATAILIAFAVLVGSNFGVVDNENLIQATCGILALFATSLLIIRVGAIERIATALGRIDGFLTGEGLRATTEDVVQSANQSLRAFERAGVVSAYRSLGDVDLAGELRLAAGPIRIISTWTGCLISISDILVEKARAGCDVRVLILRHNSDFARLRSLELDPSDALSATRQIAIEIGEFNRLFHRYPEVRSSLRVRAFDARPPMSMFAYDDTRLLAFYWSGTNAMDGPALRVVSTMDSGTGLAAIADREFERLWAHDRTFHIRVVDGEPEYLERPDLAWSADGRELTSVLEDLKRAAAGHGVQARERALAGLRDDRTMVEAAVLELHERMIVGDLVGATMLVSAIGEAGRIGFAETVLCEAVDSGFMQYLEPLVRHFLETGRPHDAEAYLRKGVEAGNYYAVFRLIKILDSAGRSDEQEDVLRTGAEAGSREAMLNLVNLLDHSNRTLDADRFLQTCYAQGRRDAGHQIAIREYDRGRHGEALTLLREWSAEGDEEAANILAGITGRHDHIRDCPA